MRQLMTDKTDKKNIDVSTSKTNYRCEKKGKEICEKKSLKTQR